MLNNSENTCKAITQEIKAKLLGYDVRITYNDYDTHEVLIQNLDELNNICKSLENYDTTFKVEYKKKYELEDSSLLYAKKETLSIDNPNILQRVILLREPDILVQHLSVDDDLSDEDIKKCYDVLSQLIMMVK